MNIIYENSDQSTSDSCCRSTDDDFSTLNFLDEGEMDCLSHTISSECNFFLMGQRQNINFEHPQTQSSTIDHNITYLSSTISPNFISGTVVDHSQPFNIFYSSCLTVTHNDMYHEPTRVSNAQTSRQSQKKLKFPQVTLNKEIIRDKFIFPRTYLNLLNSGGFVEFEKLLSNCFNSDAMFHLNTPSTSINANDSSSIFQLSVATCREFPDAVFKNKSWKCFLDATNTRVMRWRYTFEGTLLKAKADLSEFIDSDTDSKNSEKDYDPRDDIDPSSSQEERRRLEKKISLLASKKQPTTLTYQGLAIMHIDNTTNKIKKYSTSVVLKDVRSLF